MSPLENSDRRMVKLENFTEDETVLVAKAEMPPGISPRGFLKQ